jgi:hypothetical protein
MSVPMNRKWLIALVLMLMAGIVFVVWLDRPPALPAVVILPSTPLVVKSGRVPDRWIPAQWTLLRRACQFVLGHPRQVGFDIQFIEASETVASIVAQNTLGQPLAQTNGWAVWILPGRTLQRSNAASTSRSAPRIITTDGMQASVMSGGTTDRYQADMFARLEKGTVALSSRLIVVSAAQTNFIAAVRAQLPCNKALFLLDVRQPESASNRLEFLITADEYDARGNIVHATAAQ